MTGKPSSILQHYSVESVRRTAPPPGAKGTDWHRYVIVQGRNTIHGYRQGNLKAVIVAVEENVAQLNERQFGKRGRVNLALATTPKKEHN